MNNQYTVCEVAKRLSCHPNTVKRLEKRLELRIKRDYRNYRIYNDTDIKIMKNFLQTEY